jgi:hypothetical protein
VSDLKVVTDPTSPDQINSSGPALPVPSNDGLLTRRDLDMIKRDLITVRKDYNEIRENMVVLTHQYSSTPSRTFFIVAAIVWLALMAVLLVVQPELTRLAEALLRTVHHG